MARIQLRRDHAERWLLVNPVLADGEPGYEIDTGKFKIGSGDARWNDLDYFSPGDVALDESTNAALALVQAHINAQTPHPVYDDGPSLLLLYLNAKV